MGEEGGESAAEVLRGMVELGRGAWEMRRWLEVYGGRCGEGARWEVDQAMRGKVREGRELCEGRGWRREIREEVWGVMEGLRAKKSAIIPDGMKQGVRGDAVSGGGAGRRKMLAALAGERGEWLEEVMGEWEGIRGRVMRIRGEVVERNMGLVWALAGRYKRGAVGLEVEDLAQEGAAALMKAVEKYEARRGHRFSTYATWWVKQAMGRAIGEMRGAMRAPVHVTESMGRMRRCQAKFYAREGREASEEELEAELGWEAGRVRELRGLMACELHGYARSVETGWGRDGEGGDGGSLEVLSLDVGGEGALLEGLVSSAGEGYEERRGREEVARMVRRLLGRLGEQEREVVMLRFGIGVDRPLTLEEVGERFKVTRERVRQIEMRALEDLKGEGARHLLRKWGG